MNRSSWIVPYARHEKIIIPVSILPSPVPVGPPARALHSTLVTLI
jgi:hypothetical protein